MNKVELDKESGGWIVKEHGTYQYVTWGDLSIQEPYICAAYDGSVYPAEEMTPGESWHISCIERFMEDASMGRSSMVVVAGDDYVIEPGQSMTLKALLLSNKYNKLNKQHTVLLEPDSFLSQVDQDVNLLYDVDHIEKSGYLITNRTKSVIQIPKYTKLADVNVHFATKTTKVFAVLDLPLVNRLASTSDTGIWDCYWRNKDLGSGQCFNTAKAAAEEPPPDQMIDDERVDSLIRDMRASRWAKYI